MEGDKSQSDSPPVSLDDRDFPPLPTRKRPKALAVPTTSSKVQSNLKSSRLAAYDADKKNKSTQNGSVINTHNQSSTKRKMEATKGSNENDATNDKNGAHLQGWDAAYPNISKEQGSISPVKKSKLMCYRDPPTLKSLDSDTLSSWLAQSSCASESFISDGEQSTPTISPSTSTPMYENNNLGSLNDFIQQYNGTTLNSLPIDFDSSSQEAPGTCIPNGSNIVSSVDVPKSPRSGASDKKSFATSTPLVENFNNNPEIEVVANQGITQTPNSKWAKQKIEQVASKSIKSTPLILHTSSSSKPKSESLKGLKNHNGGDQPVCGCVGDHSLTPVVGLYESGKHKDIKSKACMKNPGHDGFHLPSDLKVKDLPPDIQHEDSVTFFNCLSQLVVRITVERTSDKRPSDDMYTNYIGTKSRRNGSGFIGHVDERLMKIKCKREGCCGTDDPDARFYSSSSLDDSLLTPSLVDRSLSNISTESSSSSGSSAGSTSHYYFGGVYINTNKHVIFDKSEADHAHVHFFYNTPDKKGVIYGHVASIIGVSPNQDRVTLHVMSHDRNLFNLINLHLKNASSSYKQMVQSTHMSQQVHAYGKEHSWAVIISHPHGLAKCITCGRVKRETMEARCVVKYYDAATCPGSSGGLVTTPSLLHLQWPGAVHSCSDATTGLNVTFDSRFPDLDSKHISRIHKPLLGRRDSIPDNIFSL